MTEGEYEWIKHRLITDALSFFWKCIEFALKVIGTVWPIILAILHHRGHTDL